MNIWMIIVCLVYTGFMIRGFHDFLNKKDKYYSLMEESDKKLVNYMQILFYFLLGLGYFLTGYFLGLQI